MTSFSLIDIASLVAVVCGILVITSKNPVMSVLFLISVFLSVALYLVLHGTAYLGLAYIIIYVGAIAILFLFVIMMLNIKTSDLVSTGAEYAQNLPLGTALVVFFTLTILAGTSGAIITAADSANLLGPFMNLVYSPNVVQDTVVPAASLPTLSEGRVFSSFMPDNSITNLSQIESIGIGLYTTVMIWLLGTSFILMLAMVGPIILCMERESLEPRDSNNTSYFAGIHQEQNTQCYLGESNTVNNHTTTS